jgi:hypothetical protein
MITRAAVKIYDKRQDKEMIIPCHRHCDAFQILASFHMRKNIDFVELAQGFLNEKGEFLTRVEAKQEAIRCNQLINHTNDVNLYSEDVW